jgi:hypothetical protein
MRYQALRKWRVPIAAAMLIPVAAIVIAYLSDVDAPQVTSASPPVEAAPQASSQPEQKTSVEPGSAPTRPPRRVARAPEPAKDHFILPRAARDEPCEIVMDEDNEPSCWNRYGYDPYFAYGKDTLWRLTRQGDAKATTVLSYKLRMSDPSTSLIYAVLAAQQSSKAGPLALYLERGSLGYNFKEHRVVNPDQALRAYQAFVIAEELGFAYPRPRTASRFRALLRRSGMPDQFLDDARERGLVLLNANGEA